MLQIHPNARTTPVTRAEIACSHERTGVLTQRYDVSTETIRKWRKRGASDCLDDPSIEAVLSDRSLEPILPHAPPITTDNPGGGQRRMAAPSHEGP
jgi:hypothetical protein